MKKLLSVVLLCVFALGLAGCSESEKQIVLATKPMTEQFIIAEMLIALIEQDTDIIVEHKAGIGGGTSNIHPALLQGDIDLYPEYTGTAWLFVLKEQLIRDETEMYEAVKAAYAKEFGVVWSGLYGFNDTFGLAMKKSLAEKMNIKTYSDLAEQSDTLVFGSEHDFFEREDGFIGLVDTYNFAFAKTAGMDIGLKYQAIDADQVDVINIFSTDGKLAQYGMVVLEDDKKFFPSYYCATLIRQQTLDTYPELAGVLDKLTGQISNEEMTYMNYLVEVEKKQAKDVALAHLKKKGLLK